MDSAHLETLFSITICHRNIFEDPPPRGPPKRPFRTQPILAYSNQKNNLKYGLSTLKIIDLIYHMPIIYFHGGGGAMGGVLRNKKWLVGI